MRGVDQFKHDDGDCDDEDDVELVAEAEIVVLSCTLALTAGTMTIKTLNASQNMAINTSFEANVDGLGLCICLCNGIGVGNFPIFSDFPSVAMPLIK